MKTLMLLVCTLLLFSACSKTPVSTKQSNNPEIKVSILFDFDGCRVYRFVDDGEKYFARCGGNATTSWDETHTTGKTIYTEHHQIPTAEQE